MSTIKQIYIKLKNLPQSFNYNTAVFVDRRRRGFRDMRLSRYLQTCCIEEAKFEQSIDKVNFFHDLEDRIEALLTALRPNQIIRKMTLTRQLEAATALRREWDRKRERANYEWGLVLREKLNKN